MKRKISAVAKNYQIHFKMYICLMWRKTFGETRLNRDDQFSSGIMCPYQIFLKKHTGI